jgi:hypothetical protein
MKSPEEMANTATAEEKTQWLFDPARTPREIVRFLNCPAGNQFHQLARAVLEVRISEIAEASSLRLEAQTKQLVYLTYALAALTLGLLIFTIALYVCEQRTHP